MESVERTVEGETSISGDSDIEQQHESCQGRKRLRFEDQWARKKRKLRKDRGKSYKTYKGEHKDSKRLSITFSFRCHLNCSARVGLEDRKRIFGEFYRLSNHDSQNKYLFGLIERVQPKQRRLRTSSGQPRGNSFMYFVRFGNGDRVRVCKHVFCKIHGIGKRRVEDISTKLAAGVLFSGDNRGRHNNRPHTICSDLKDQIREHILSFPSRESHYSRQNNERKYLPEGLSIARMYRLYLEKYEPTAAEKLMLKNGCIEKFLTRNLTSALDSLVVTRVKSAIS